MTATKEYGYILDYDTYDGRSVQTHEFDTLPELRAFIEDKTIDVKNHLIWYNITKKVESGTYTQNTFFESLHLKKRNIPEPRIGDERLRR